MKKSLLVFISLFMVQLVSSCCGDLETIDETISRIEASITPLETLSSNEFVSIKVDLIHDQPVLSENSLGFSSVRACSPDSEFNYLKDWSIRSNARLSEVNAGEDLSDYFELRDEDNEPIVLEFVDEVIWLLPYRSIYLVLKESPKIESEHAFTLEFDLDDGRSFTVQTEPVIITP